MQYDLCIIGAGVGGGALAQALAPTGKKILLLNRLGSLPREAEKLEPLGALYPGPLQVRRAVDR